MKTVDISETIAACDLKIGRCRQVDDSMKVRMWVMKVMAISCQMSFTYQN